MRYEPNQVSFRKRAFNIIASIILIAHGTYGVATDSLLLPAKWGKVLELYGISAWIMYLAILTLVFYLLLEVIDHYDTRNNEEKYGVLRKAVSILGYSFFGIALVASFYVNAKNFECFNDVVEIASNGPNNQSAILFKRTCTRNRPDGYYEPSFQITIQPAQEMIPDEPGNAALLQKSRFLNMEWVDDLLILSVEVKKCEEGNVSPNIKRKSRSLIRVLRYKQDALNNRMQTDTMPATRALCR